MRTRLNLCVQLTSTCRDMRNVHAHLLRSQPEMTNAIGFKRQLFMPDSLAVDGLSSQLERLQKRFIGLNPDPALMWTLTLDLKTVQTEKLAIAGKSHFGVELRFVGRYGNIRHAPCNMQHAPRRACSITCNMRHATCDMRHATCMQSHFGRASFRPWLLG